MFNEGIPVHKTDRISKLDGEGKPRLFLYAMGAVFVHPDNWDAFLDALDQANNVN